MSEETNVEQEQETQGTSENFLDSLPEDLRGEPSLQDIKDLGSLAKGYVHAQKMTGADKVVLPSANASDEEMGEFYNKLGRPEQADGYEVPTENMPQVDLDKDLLGGFFEEAHRVGLNKQQAAALVRWQAQQTESYMSDAVQQQESGLEEAQAKMRKEFGAAYDQKMEMATTALKQFGGEELVNLLNSTGLGNEPAVIKAFANVGKAIANDEIIGGGGRQGFLMSPSEAKQAIADRKKDPNFMKSYQERDAMGHKEAVSEMQKLFATAYPTGDA